MKQEIGAKEDAEQSLQREIQGLQASKARNEALLQNQRRCLSKAESEKCEAEKRKDGAVTGTIAGGVAAVVFGAIFPPSLAVTVPAVAAAGTISISDANKAVDRCRDEIRDIEGKIDREAQEIRNAESKINGIINYNVACSHLKMQMRCDTAVFLRGYATIFIVYNSMCRT